MLSQYLNYLRLNTPREKREKIDKLFILRVTAHKWNQIGLTIRHFF